MYHCWITDLTNEEICEDWRHFFEDNRRFNGKMKAAERSAHAQFVPAYLRRNLITPDPNYKPDAKEQDNA